MHIFLVNDDGFGAPGIVALADAAASRGHEITMVAPKAQQSAKSHSFTLSQPLFVKEAKTDWPNCHAFILDGLPADCVRLGMLCLVKSPVDVLISGINNGLNAGMDVPYSGTVGAAMEGTFHGLPSIAASIMMGTSKENLARFASFVVQKAEKYAAQKVPDYRVLNINAPKEAWKGEKYCPLGTSFFSDHYIRTETPRCGTCYWLDDGIEKLAFQPGTDDDWLSQGYLTYSLICPSQAAPQAEFDALSL